MFSNPEQDTALSQLASRLGPQPIDRVAQAAALCRIMPYFDELAGEGVALPGIDPLDVVTLRPLTDLLDTLACDTIPGSQAGSTTRTLDVHFSSDKANYKLVIKRQKNGWEARSWHFASQLTLANVQSAYLLLVGVIPSESVIARVPWGLVPGFVETAQKLQHSTASNSDALTIQLPANVVALALTHALVQGATLTLDE